MILRWRHVLLLPLLLLPSTLTEAGSGEVPETRQESLVPSVIRSSSGARRVTGTPEMSFAQVIPGSLTPGSVHTLQVLFTVGLTIPLGSVQVEAPTGFDFGQSCVISELGDAMYRTNPVGGLCGKLERVSIASCTSLAASGSSNRNMAQVDFKYPLNPSKTFAFALQVTNPSDFAGPDVQLGWVIRTLDSGGSLVEVSGGGVTSFKGTPSADTTDGWGLYSQNLVVTPTMRWGDLLPFQKTMTPSYVTFVPLQVASSVMAPLRVTAPPGYIWEPGIESTGYWQARPPGSTVDFPGAIPYVVGDLFLVWNTSLNFTAGLSYGFRVPIRIPSWPEKGHVFYLEIGFQNASLASGLRPVAAVLPGPDTLRGVRAAWVDYATARTQEVSNYVRIELISASPAYPGDGFLFIGGDASKRLQCSCFLPERRPDVTCDVTAARNGQIVMRIVAIDTQPAGKHSFGFSCSNPAGIIDVDTWNIGNYQKPGNYPTVSPQLDAAAEVPGFGTQEPMPYFQRRSGGVGFDPRPKQQSSQTLVFKLSQVAAGVAARTLPSSARLRAPEGVVFSKDCLAEVITDFGQVFNTSNSTLLASIDEAELPAVFLCEGRGHVVFLSWDAPLPRNVTFAFRVLYTNPDTTTDFNYWSLEVDDQSSTPVEGPIIQTFKTVSIQFAAAAARIPGSELGGDLSNKLRLEFATSITAESMLVTAPTGYDFGTSGNCTGIRFTGKPLGVEFPVEFTVGLRSCSSRGRELEIQMLTPGSNLTPSNSYTLDADILMESNATAAAESFLLQSTQVGGGLGDRIYSVGPTLVPGLRSCSVKRAADFNAKYQIYNLQSKESKSQEAALIDISVAFDAQVQVGDRLKMALPPGFSFDYSGGVCNVTWTSPAFGPPAACSCKGFDCSVIFTVTADLLVPRACNSSNAIERCGDGEQLTWATVTNTSGTLLRLGAVVVHPQSVPVEFENYWGFTLLNSAQEKKEVTRGSGVFHGWEFLTAMTDAQVSISPGSVFRAGAAGAVLSFTFIPANGASRLIFTASAPSGWGFLGTTVCELSADGACVTPLVAAASPNIFELPAVEIKARIRFSRQLRNVQLASGGGPAQFEVATWTAGQMGGPLLVDTSGLVTPFRLPGSINITYVNLRTMHGLVEDPADLLRAQLPPRLGLMEGAFVLEFVATQVGLPGDTLVLKDSNNLLGLSKDSLVLSRILSGVSSLVGVEPLLVGSNELHLRLMEPLAANTIINLQITAQALRNLPLPARSASTVNFLSLVIQREGENLPLATSDGIITAGLLQLDKWAAASQFLPFTLDEVVGAPISQVEVSGEVAAPDLIPGPVVFVAPLGVKILSPCQPTACTMVAEDFAGSGRDAAIGLSTDSGKYGLRVELPRQWVGTRTHWLMMAPSAAFPSGGVAARSWGTQSNVVLRQMPAAVVYAAVAKTLGNRMTVKFTPGDAALRLLPGGARCYIRLRAPRGYVLRCDGNFQAVIPPAPAEATCMAGASPSEAIVALDNARLQSIGELFFTFGLDTPAATPSPNLFEVTLLDAGNITLDSNVDVPGLIIPPPRVRSQVAIGVAGFESLAWLEAWAAAARQTGAIASSIAGALNISDISRVSVDGVVARLGQTRVPLGRRLQRWLQRWLQSLPLQGELAVSFSVTPEVVSANSSNVNSRDVNSIASSISSQSFAVDLVASLARAVSSSGLASIQVQQVLMLATPTLTLAPNITTPTLRWASSTPNASTRALLLLLVLLFSETLWKFPPPLLHD
mmetsp:Transcript_35446/g.63994  ORF Transcript_35446/g.63994 Transcript_35446/m.63994 type:complete len:1752 (+) Transcript_35446:72-5327(+)